VNGGTTRVQDTFEPVIRPRVIELLARVTRRRIGLVVAPAGYGKSVAVTQYLAQAEISAAWFVVREEHTKLVGFAFGLARALSHEVPGLKSGVLAAYQSTAADADASVMLAAWFAAQLDDVVQTVVVDDLHLALEEPSVRDFFVALIERAPLSVRWILLSRSALDLPLATWLAYGHADEPAGEDDLRIRSSEAAAIAEACNIALNPGYLEELLALTEGWPAAFIFALRAAARGAELGRIAAETREKLYAFLADQAFAELSPREQQFLLGTALLPVVDLERLAAAGWDEPEATYARLRRHAGFIVPESATTFAYHDLFRDFLQHRLRLQGPTTYRRTQLASATFLEAADRADLALRLRVAAKDRTGVIAMLHDQASRPTLTGMVDAIEEAFLFVSPGLLHRDPELLGLLARTRVLRNAWEEAKTLYEAAIGRAKTTGERAKLTLAYAESFIRRQGHEAAFIALCDLDTNEIEDLATRGRVLSRLAMYRAMRGEYDEAQRLASQTLGATVLGDPDSRADALLFAALVSHTAGRLGEARTRATEALRTAEQTGNSYIIARSSYCLSAIAINDGDWGGAAQLLGGMLVHARREGDLVAANSALRTALFLATIRADGAGIGQAVAALGPGFTSRADYDGLYSFARAIHSAWKADFAAACREAAAGLQAPAAHEWSYQILALPHLAVYHAAAGDRDATVAALERATTVLVDLSTREVPRAFATFTDLGRIMLAVAHSLGRKSRAATEVLAQLERSDPKAIPAVKYLVQAVRTFNRIVQGAAERDALDRDLAKVREHGLGGYADLLAALSAGIARTAAFGALTKTESQMLRLIARGGTTKAIAVELNRSPDTVETHVRAILRKLGCKSRSEAVALARDHGIL
jgi:ATP/maltotriose-dependent transcriptional regulator MalT